jgi:hypothetical protein
VKVKKTMSDYLEQVLGEDWKSIFNVEDFSYPLRYYLEDDPFDILSDDP